MHFVSFPKIGQYGPTVQYIASEERFIGFAENGDPIYDGEKVLGKVTFTGTVKLHGTNSAIAMRGEEYWCQSRENIITPLKDNCGFATHFSGKDKIEAITNIICDIKKKNGIRDDKIVVLFGEWAGPGVQKGVGISQIPQKSFFLFAIRVISPVKIITETNQEGRYESDQWLDIDGIRDHSIRFYNINDYQKFSVEVDLNSPGDVVAYLQGLVDAVEKECPVAKALGASGIGEGIVWEATWKGTRRIFKTKGKEHAVVVHKDGKTVHADTEKVNSIQEFCNYAVTEPRLEQGLEKVFMKIKPTMEKTGDFIKWVVKDVVTEEIDAISKNNLSTKDVSGEIAKRSKDWLHKKINEG